MTINFSRVPVRFISTNDELIKSTEYAGSHVGGTDYKQDSVVPETNMGPMYRVPMDRWNGNSIFRRYSNGSLDIDYAVQKVVDAIHMSMDGVPLNSEQRVTLSCLFPGIYSYIDQSIADSVLRTTLRVSMLECADITSGVAEHMRREREFMLSSHAR